MLHPLPYRYGEGDLNAFADGCYPQAGDAFGTAEQTPGQRQGRSLVDAEPVTLHELDPANDRNVGQNDQDYTCLFVHLSKYIPRLVAGAERKPVLCRS